MFDYPIDWRKGEGVRYTCSCSPTQYSPTFIPDQHELKVFFCRSCGHYLSNFQADCYNGSLSYDHRIAEIEEQRERRKKNARLEGESIYDEVR